jgi:hypothetical protein
VETTDQNVAAYGAIEDGGSAKRSVARRVDCKRRGMLPCGYGTAGHSVFIERGAAVAAQALLNERTV